MEEKKIGYLDRVKLMKFFNRGGSVFDFTIQNFNDFTSESIGIPLCQKYNLSRGKSLEAYIKEAPLEDSLKLLFDLLDYYDASGLSRDIMHLYLNPNIITDYQECKSILNKLKQSTILNKETKKLKDVFNSDYIASQIDLMVKMQDDNPTEAIGKAKELIESCCKTILEKEGHIIGKDWDMTRLVDETFKLFGIMPKEISDDVKGAKSIKQVLGNLKAIAQGISELRNLYGSGHGKSSSFTGLEPRHASLAVGSSVTLVRFLWDSYERYKHISSKG